MTRLEKCELLKSKGFTYDKETGKIFGVRGKEVNRTDKQGYIILYANSSIGNVKSHHFAWFITYGNVDFEMLDHINQIKTDNRISNLRIVSHSQNMYNTNSKGYYWHKSSNKWRSRITFEGKNIHLGYFNTEEEARQAYISAKSVYHRLI
jgi:hypothetical protein